MQSPKPLFTYNVFFFMSLMVKAPKSRMLKAAKKRKWYTVLSYYGKKIREMLMTESTRAPKSIPTVSPANKKRFDLSCRFRLLFQPPQRVPSLTDLQMINVAEIKCTGPDHEIQAPRRSARARWSIVEAMSCPCLGELDDHRMEGREALLSKKNTPRDISLPQNK